METQSTKSTDLELWLAWSRAPCVKPARGRELIQQYGGIASIFASAATIDLPPPARGYLEAPDWKGVEQDLEWLARPDHSLVTIVDPGYPPRLLEIPDPPPVLFVAGSVEALSHPQLAMVGSRNATPAATDTAFDFARALASIGLGITSGLALGIDTASHRGALAGDGYTLAVLGCGPDQVYPRQNGALLRQICDNGGAVLSEFPTGVGPLARHFPRRNRIISGLSIGVLVVEAAVQSGSLITARFAMEHGREVFAIPGSIHNPLARGCHGLIRHGAKLVETADDILEEVGPLLSLPAARGRERVDDVDSPESGLAEDYVRLLESVDYDPTPVDRLVERTRLTPQVVSSMLLQLELGGYVSSISGGRYTRTARNPK